MKFIHSKRKNRDMDEFSKREWSIADRDHYGTEIEWTENPGYIRAVQEKDILGIIRYNISMGVLKISTLMVSHSHHRKGIGKKLVHKAIELGKKDNCHKIYLETGAGWDSVKFYEALGFKKEGLLKNHYVNRDWIQFSKFI